jgi:Leucine-rich repeat (LRR) protein
MLHYCLLIITPVTRLEIYNNQIKSLEGLADSNVTELNISDNKIRSLEGLAGSNVTILFIDNNPCYEQFKDEFEYSIQKVKEWYEFDEIKDPGFE